MIRGRPAGWANIELCVSHYARRLFILRPLGAASSADLRVEAAAAAE